MDSMKKLDMLEKQIEKMVKIIDELNAENSRLKEEIWVLSEKEKTLLARLKEKDDNRKSRDIIVKRLEKLSKMIDKEIER